MSRLLLSFVSLRWSSSEPVIRRYCISGDGDVELSVSIFMSLTSILKRFEVNSTSGSSAFEKSGWSTGRLNQSVCFVSHAFTWLNYSMNLVDHYLLLLTDYFWKFSTITLISFVWASVDFASICCWNYSTRLMESISLLPRCVIVSQSSYVNWSLPPRSSPAPACSAQFYSLNGFIALNDLLFG